MDRGHPSARDEAQRLNGWFGKNAEGATDLFRLGPNADRIGQKVSQAQVSTSSHRAVLQNENLFQDIRPDDPRIPALIQGEIELGDGPAPAAGAALGVAVNGIIRATTRIHLSPNGKLAWSALVPEEALAVGENAIEVFLLGSGSALTRLDAAGSQDAMRATWESSATTLLKADGSTGWDGFVGARAPSCAPTETARSRSSQPSEYFASICRASTPTRPTHWRCRSRSKARTWSRPSCTT